VAFEWKLTKETICSWVVFSVDGYLDNGGVEAPEAEATQVRAARERYVRLFARLGFGVWDLHFRVSGFGFRVSGFGSWVSGLI